MTRFHVHLEVDDLERSSEFYSRLFGAAPAVRKPGYAKWMLDDPGVNFAISSGRGRAGISHLGLQADSAAGLDALRERLLAAGAVIHDEKAANCCYAVSDKHWAADPQGIAWEAFHTVGEAATYGDDRGPAAMPPGQRTAAGCCGTQSGACC